MSIGSLARFVNLSLLRIEQKILFINFNFETYLSYEEIDTHVVRKSLKHKKCGQNSLKYHFIIKSRNGNTAFVLGIHSSCFQTSLWMFVKSKWSHRMTEFM